ncbi:unnamed protein product [Peniophora sp. CBMAI 1063]|nr:unnamed protein product [Peniophora sp. CBMAI 1063]
MRASRRASTLVANSIISAVLLADTLFTVVLCLPRSSGASAFLALLTRDKLSGTPAVTITPTFLAGVLLVTVGTHELVTTGPYSVIRHPAYPARFAVLLGASMCTFRSGSWWKETGQGNVMMGRLVLAAWMAMIARDVVVLLFVMIPREEKMLRKAFGKQWTDWASQTRYKMIPGIW